ncbi:MAG: group I intron-associated PD-(D/E)XK endonuclease [Solirubrobacteraceae bacterium]
MAELKRRGELAEMKVAADLVARGFRVAFPFGEDWDVDLIVCRGRSLERVQVKHVAPDGITIEVRCYSQSLTAGRVMAVKHYTAETIDWLAVYDSTTDRCFYVPASELGEGRYRLSLRLVPPSYRRLKDVRLADTYADLPAA